MATLFASTTYLGTLAVLGVVCFGLERYNPKFGAEGSFVVMAVIFSIFLPGAALGFHLAKRKVAHSGWAVVMAGFGSGLAIPLIVFLLDWMFSARFVMYAVPILGIFLAGFASARLTESGLHLSDQRKV